MRRESAACGAVFLMLALWLSGCTGGFAPALPSPDGDVGRSTIATSSEGQLLPDDLGVGSFTVTLDGSPAEVRQAIPSREGGISICFVLDATGSMEDTITGVIDSIEEFAAGFTGLRVYWSGIEYGDGTPSDGLNTWDFSFPPDSEDLVQGQRTLVQPAEGLTALQAWLAPLEAIGGGDNPENPLKALMEARQVMAWPAGVARHFIVLTDVGAHQSIDPPPNPDWSYPRPDGQPFCPYMGSEVLAAFRGWGVIHAVSPDWSDQWSSPAAARANNGRMNPQLVDTWDGWDVRELADGGPPESRTHDGTGGKWVEMPGYGDVDLTQLGLADFIKQSYTIVYMRPPTLASAHVVITATYTEGGVPQTATFDLGLVTF